MCEKMPIFRWVGSLYRISLKNWAFFTESKIIAYRLDVWATILFKNFWKIFSGCWEQNSGKSDIFRRLGRNACLMHIHEAICISRANRPSASTLAALAAARGANASIFNALPCSDYIADAGLIMTTFLCDVCFAYCYRKVCRLSVCLSRLWIVAKRWQIDP